MEKYLQLGTKKMIRKQTLKKKEEAEIHPDTDRHSAMYITRSK